MICDARCCQWNIIFGLPDSRLWQCVYATEATSPFASLTVKFAGEFTTDVEILQIEMDNDLFLYFFFSAYDFVNIIFIRYVCHQAIKIGFKRIHLAFIYNHRSRYGRIASRF